MVYVWDVAGCIGVGGVFVVCARCYLRSDGHIPPPPTHTPSYISWCVIWYVRTCVGTWYTRTVDACRYPPPSIQCVNVRCVGLCCGVACTVVYGVGCNCVWCRWVCIVLCLAMCIVSVSCMCYRVYRLVCTIWYVIAGVVVVLSLHYITPPQYAIACLGVS